MSCARRRAILVREASTLRAPRPAPARCWLCCREHRGFHAAQAGGHGGSRRRRRWRRRRRHWSRRWGRWRRRQAPSSALPRLPEEPEERAPRWEPEELPWVQAPGTTGSSRTSTGSDRGVNRSCGWQHDRPRGARGRGDPGHGADRPDSRESRRHRMPGWRKRRQHASKPRVIERSPILRGFVSSLLAQRLLARVFQLEVTLPASCIKPGILCGATHPLGVYFQYRQWRHLALCVRECT